MYYPRCLYWICSIHWIFANHDSCLIAHSPSSCVCHVVITHSRKLISMEFGIRVGSSGIFCPEKIFVHLYFLYIRRIPYSCVNYVLYYKIPYYSGTLIYDSVYGHSVSTRGLFLSFCLSTLCTYSLIVYSGLITFLCINLIWFIYSIIINNYYYMYYCSDSFYTVYVVIYWQVLYPLLWISGILNKWLWFMIKTMHFTTLKVGLYSIYHLLLWLN
jgi:hypothetical protein